MNTEADKQGITRSNIGGWHSNTDLFRWDADCVRTLQQRVQEMVSG